MNNIYLTSKEINFNDSNYRYKINNLNVKSFGKQDNWTTYILNSEDISKIINRPSEYFGKYISYALSCPMKQDKDKKCLSFKGNYSNEIITKYFMEFIKIYVLCPECDLPETKLIIEKNLNKTKNLMHKCNACGLTSQIKNTNDKTFDYIEKNTK